MLDTGAAFENRVRFAIGDNGRAPVTRHQTFTYWIVAGLVGVTLVYDLSWVALEIATRLDLVPDQFLGFQASGFSDALTIWNDIAYYSKVVLAAAAFVLILRRSRHTLAAYALSTLAGFIDWILLLDNPFYDGTGGGHLLTVISIALCGVLWLMNQQRILR